MCEPGFDYGRVLADWTLSPDRHRADATRRRSDDAACRPTCCSGSRPTTSAPGTCSTRARSCSVALSWDDQAPVPTTVEEANAQLKATTRFWRHWLSRARIPDHEFRAADPALGARDQGADVHADGRDRRRADHVAARDPGWRAQLGLPLHLDPRLDVHAPGAALPRPRLGGRRVHAVHRRPRAQRRRRPADHVRDRRPSRPDRGAPQGSQRLRRRQPGPDRQRRVRPAPERRVRRRARLGAAAHAPQPAAAAAAVAADPGAGRVRQVGLEAAGPGDLGGSRQAAALRLLQADVLGGDGPRRKARGHSRRDTNWPPNGARSRTRSRPTSSSTESTSAACSSSTTTPSRSMPRRCWRRSSGSSRARTSACARACSRSPTS